MAELSPAHGADADQSGLRTRLAWRLNRLRCMTPLEIGHRLARSVTIRVERAGLIGADPVPAPELASRAAAWVHVAEVDPLPYAEAADRIAAGRLTVFALEDCPLGTPPRWNRDPKTGIEAPMVYGKMLDYRDASLVGDCKYLWEPNRHLQFVTLAQAWALTRDARHAQALAAQLTSWFDACPWPLGPNWASALEPALRLINWAIAWQLIGGIDSEVFPASQWQGLRARWLESVYRHAQFVRGHFSRHSSANNHLIGEAAGLFIASLTWPHWPAARRWQRVARGILEREVLRQNAPDGVNREQATSYQQYEADLLLIVLLAARANGIALSRAFETRLESMIEFLASVMDAGGNVPMFGDSDDGAAVRLAQPDGASTLDGPVQFCRFRSVIAAGAVLFRRGDLKAKAQSLDEKTRWLLGDESVAVFRELPARPDRLPVRRSFPGGGYYVLGSSFESADEVRVVVDAGPLGYTTIAAHGHADALSFTLSLGGVEFLVDPGTYAYHTQGAWRRYFRGTAAHNTLRVDGRDQSEQGGNFMWLDKARAGCRRFTPGVDRDVFEGWHDGYSRLADPVVHTRRLSLEHRASRLVVEDRLEASRSHQVELFFHFAEECRVSPAPGGFVAERAGIALRLVLPADAQGSARVHHGSIAPIAGWTSRRFDVKRASPTVVWRASTAGACVLRTEFGW